MATVALFHSVLGIRQGVLDAAERMRSDGHEVHVPDLYDGRIFDDYPAAMAFADSLDFEAQLGRAMAAVCQLPVDLVTAGFSAGCAPAVYVATQRPVSGVVMFAEALAPSAFEMGLSWPTSVSAQSHAKVDDPFREQEMVELAIREVAAAGGTLEVFDYPGTGHLFTDATLPDEYDPAATELLWSRVLPFLGTLS